MGYSSWSEGGFSDEERKKINEVNNLSIILLGPRILRLMLQ